MITENDAKRFVDETMNMAPTGAGILDQVRDALDLGDGCYMVHVCNPQVFLKGDAFLSRDGENCKIEIKEVVSPTKYYMFFFGGRLGCDWIDGYLVIKSPLKPEQGDCLSIVDYKELQ